MSRKQLYIMVATLAAALPAWGRQAPEPSVATVQLLTVTAPQECDAMAIDISSLEYTSKHSFKPEPVSIYALPYSMTANVPDWHRLWVNTATLSGAFVGTLFVLECLPEDATTWNRAELQKVPLFTRWWDHVMREGPEWDHDNPVFNFVLHPYAGAAYFMAARSNGFNFYRSLLYSACISTIGWEFGIEAFMERPSYQDLFITPLVGSLMGEGFYRLKRLIVDNGYEILGSRLLATVAAFILDPVNEVVGIFDGNPARRTAAHMQLQPQIGLRSVGFAFSATF